MHRATRTGREAVVLASLFLSALAPGAASQSALPREVPDQPPSALIAADPSLPRSAGLAFTFGAYTSTQVNVDGSGMNIVGDAANEPSIAVSPFDQDVAVIGWRQFNSISSSFREAGWAYTSDGGQSWTFPGTLEPGVFRSDPVLDVDSSGDFYYQSLSQGSGGNIQNEVFKSTNGGVSWGTPVSAFGGDKNWLAIDRTGGPGDGHVYGTWQPFFDCCAGLTLTRSTDAGASFQQPVGLDKKPLFGTMTVGADGTLFVSGVQGTVGQDFDTYVLTRSADAQNPLASPTSTGVIVDMGGGMTLGAGPNPSGLLGQVDVAVDDSGGPFHGTVYMLGSIDPNGGFGVGPTEVRIAASFDGGATFGPSVRVNDDPPGNNNWHWLAACDTAPDGRLDVVWYDTRNSGQENISQLFYSYSYDGGATFAPNVAVTPSFDSFLGWPQQSKMGDYTGIVGGTDGSDVAYCATFNGEQDVYHVRVFPLGSFTDLGLGLAGAGGTPSLTGTGSLLPNSTLELTLTGAAGNTAAGVFVGLTRVDAAFKGGVLVPAPDVVLTGFTTNGTGGLDIHTTWPANLPSGFDLFTQIWTVDPGGPSGFAASNGLQLTTP
jgi:hypothetical protein